MTFRLSGRLLCRTVADVELVKTYLPEHTRLTLAESGCRSFEVRQTDDPMIWTVEEEFATRADFDAHQTRTRASAWGRKTEEIPRDYKILEA